MDIHNTIHFKSYIECDFRVPASDNAQPNLLTYGSLLCILNFVCKTLYQVNLFIFICDNTIRIIFTLKIYF